MLSFRLFCSLMHACVHLLAVILDLDLDFIFIVSNLIYTYDIFFQLSVPSFPSIPLVHPLQSDEATTVTVT